MGTFLAIILLLISFEVHAANVLITYDVSGNPSAQQIANAAAPFITAQPYNKQIVALGESVGFSVNVSSVLPTTYQWYFNGNAISGATGDSLYLTNFAAANEGNYTVKVTNSSGSVTSAVATPYVDANGNGLPDSWEMAYFGNLNQTASGDYDGDGISNLQEFYNGTDPTVRQVYYWNVASGNFTNPLNWIRPDSPGVAPQAPGTGDTAVINTGTFTVPSNTLIAASSVTVNVSFAVPTDSDCILDITGSWTFNGAVALASGRTFAVTGGGSATVAGAANIGAASLHVYGTNSKLVFSALTSYAQPASDTRIVWQAGQDYQDNTGCELDFLALKTITGSLAANNDDNSLNIDAIVGATLKLPALTSVTLPAGTAATYSTNGARFVARDSGTINAPALTSFSDSSTDPSNGRSSLTAYNNGTISASKLLAPVGIDINLNAQSNPQQFTSLNGTNYFEINAGAVTMTVSSISGHIIAEGGGVQVIFSKLASLNNVVQLLVDGDNSKLSFPLVTNYAQPAADTQVVWQAGKDYQTNTGCELDLPALKTITGSLAAYNDSNDLDINAVVGATINLPVLTSVTVPAGTAATYSTNGTRFVARDSGTLSLPMLSSFSDSSTDPSNGRSSLNAYNSGVIAAPKLLAPVGIDLNLNSQSNPQQFTSLNGTTHFELNAGTVTMSVSSISGSISAIGVGTQLTFSNVPSLSNVTSLLVNGDNSKLSFPQVTSYTHPSDVRVVWQAGQDYQTNNGCELDIPALKTITGSLAAYNDDSSLNIDAVVGATINLSALTTITMPAGTAATYSTNGTRLVARDSGTLNAPMLNTFNDSSTDPSNGRSSLIAYNSGVISAPKLLAPAGIDIDLNAQSNPQQFTSLTGTTNFEINAGAVTMLVSSISGNVSAQGSGVQLTFSNVTSLNNVTQVLVNGTGSKLSFPAMTSYVQLADVRVVWQAGQDYQDNTGCELDLPALTSITGSLAAYNDDSSLNIDAVVGATINLPALTMVTVPAGTAATYSTNGTRFVARDSGTINAVQLSKFSDNSTDPSNGRSSLSAYNSGVISAPKLLAPVGIDLNLNSQSNPQQFTSLNGTTYIRINSGKVAMQVSSLMCQLVVEGGAQLSFPNLTSLNNITNILVDGTGSKLSFASVTSYVQPTNTYVIWQAGQSYVDNTGCELDFPALRTITGSVTTVQYTNDTFNLVSYNGGTVNLPALTTITMPSGTTGYASSSGVNLSAHDSGTLSAPVLSSFVDNTTNPTSSLTAYNNGTFILGDLASSGTKGVTLNGVTLPATIQPIPIVSAVKTGGNIMLTVQTLTGHTYQLQQTNSLSAGGWQNVGSAQSGTGSAMNFTTSAQGTAQFFRIVISPWP